MGLVSPEQLIKSGLEDGEQTALFAWLAMNVFHTPELAYAFAIPNGGMRDKITAARLKAQGVRPGVPDTMFPVIRYVDNKWWPGMWVEMKKVKGGKLHDANQLRWGEFLRGQGYAHFLCKGYYEAREPIKWYFGLHLPWRNTV